MVSGEASVSIDSEIGSVVNSSLSTYSFTAEGIGGSIQSFGNFSQFASNYSAWATSFNEDDSYSVLVDVPDQGLLTIWDLLPDEYSTERTALINAFNAMADSQYSEFLGLFMKNVDYGDYVNFAGGTGTPSDPYKIATVDHLRNIDKFLDDGTHFILISDIDTTAKYSNWDPIGTNESSSESLTSNIFKGNFNGNGHTIKYQINSIDSSNSENLYQFVGLFGYTKDASIDNLTVDATINVSDLLAYTIFAGGISGKSVSSDFSDCSNVGDIYLKNTTVFGFSGNIYAGGITGSMIHGNYTNCINEANIYASSGIAASGGIVSSQSDTSFSNCSNSATLFAQIVLRDRVMPGPTGDLYAFDLNDIG